MDSMCLDVQKRSLTVRLNFCSFSDQGTSVRSLTLGLSLQGLKYSSPNCDRSIQHHIILLKFVTAIRPTCPSDSKYMLGRWPWNRSRWPFASPGCVIIIRKLCVCTSVRSRSGNWQASSTTESLEPCRIGWTTALADSWSVARMCDQILNG